MARTTAVKNLLIKPVVLTADRALTDSDAGKTYFLDKAAGLTVTLPAPRAGVGFEFIIKTAGTGNYNISTKGDENVIIGQVYTADQNAPLDADFDTTAVGDIDFQANFSSVGDSVSVISDGTYWYAKCYAAISFGIKLT